MTGLLVTGTDTGVGKTWVTCAIARALAATGLRVGVMKPCETGVESPANGGLPPGSDAAALADASGCSSAPEDILPYAFALAAAPSVAAVRAGVSVDIGMITVAYARVAQAHDVVLVEGAGGVAVPLAEGLSYLGLGRHLDLPVLIVARTKLGTLNHTALTVRAVRSAGLSVAGVVLNHADGVLSPADQANLKALDQLIPSPILATFPHDAPLPAREMDALVSSLRRTLG